MGIEILKKSAAAGAAIFVFLAGSMTLGGSGVATAQTPSPDNDTLIISPPITERSVNPGDEFSYKVTLTNQSPRARAFTAKTTNAEPQGEDGSSSLVPDEGPFAVASWVTVTPATANLGPGEDFEATITVKVPADAGPGSRFGGIVFTPAPTVDTSGSAVEVRAEISSLLLVDVSGDADRNLKLTQFKTDKGFYNGREVQFETKFQNEGNIVARPAGTITIKNIFGQKVQEIKINPQRVLPTATRRFESDWNSKSRLFGPYSATLEWSVDGQQTESKRIWLWGAPVAFLIAIAVTIVVLFVFVWLPRKRIRKAIKAFKQG